MVLSEKGGATTVFLSSEERVFLNTQGVGPTEIITSYIRQQKQIINGFVTDNVFEERKLREKYQKLTEELSKKIFRMEKELKEVQH
jgi:hypothetical protein